MVSYYDITFTSLSSLIVAPYQIFANRICMMLAMLLLVLVTTVIKGQKLMMMPCMTHVCVCVP
jgi:hypothetical protein